MNITPSSSFYVPTINSFFKEAEEQNFLITASNRSWMVQLKSVYNFDPVVKIFRNVIMRAFNFDENIGFTNPDEASLLGKTQALGFDLSKKEQWAPFIRTLPYALCRLFLTTPPKLTLLVKENLNLVTHKKWFVVEFSTQAALDPLVDLFISPILPQLEGQTSCLLNIDTALKTYRSRFFEGSYSLVNEALLKKITRLFFMKMSCLNDYILSENKLMILESNPLKLNLVISKKPELTIYAFFLDRSWEGSYKRVFLGVKITDKLEPVGLSESDISASVCEVEKEIFFRRHPHISKVLTPLFFDWKEKETQKHYMIHSWCGLGSLRAFLKSEKSQSLPILDQLALQMLTSLDTFHKYGAVHKDLSSTNFIVDAQGDKIAIFINDVGSSCLQNNTKELRMITTSSNHLAPELLNKCIPIGGFHWDTVFEVPLNFKDWVYNERFQIAILILNLYLRTNPYLTISPLEKLHEQLLELYAHQQTDLTLNPICHSLDEYLNPVQKNQLIGLYENAYHGYNKAIKGGGEVSFSTLFYSKSRVDLSPYLEDCKSLATLLYTQAYHKMCAAFENHFYSSVARFIVSNTTPIVKLLPKMDKKMEARIKALSPLLDLDRAKRPDLITIRAALQVAILYNP